MSVRACMHVMGGGGGGGMEGGRLQTNTYPYGQMWRNYYNPMLLILGCVTTKHVHSGNFSVETAAGFIHREGVGVQYLFN